MAIPKGVQTRVRFLAWDIINNSFYTGDASNITAKLHRDNNPLSDPTNQITRVDAINAPGVYELVLTSLEMSCDVISIYPKGPSGVICEVITIYTDTGIMQSIKNVTDSMVIVDVGGENAVRSLVAGCETGAITASSLADNTITASKIAADAIGASELASDAVQEIASAILLNANNKLATDVNGRVTVGSYASGLSPAEQILSTPSNKLTTDTSGRVTIGSIIDDAVDAIWNRLRSAVQRPAGSFGDYLDAKISGISGSGITDWTADERKQIRAALGITGETLTPETSGYVSQIKQKTDNLSFTSGNVNANVSSYSAGQSPSQLILSNPSNKLTTDSSGRVTVGTNNDKTGYSLASSEYSSIATAVWNATSRTLTDVANIVSAIFNNLVEGTKTFTEYIRIIAAVLFGDVSGGQTGNITIKSPIDNNKTRVNATVDQYGNRDVTNIDGS